MDIFAILGGQSLPGHCTNSPSNKAPNDSSLLWDCNKHKMEPPNLFEVKQQQQQQQQYDSSCNKVIEVASFWGYNPYRASPERGRLRPTKSLPCKLTTSAWNAFMPAISEASSKAPSLRRNSSIQRGVPRSASSTSSTSTNTTTCTHQHLEEENELLREQVSILQATMEEREQEKTGDSVSLLEDSVATRESSWHNKEHKLTRELVHNENDNEAQLQRVIELSMELAESQAQVDSLQGKLQHAEHQVEKLKQQLVTVSARSSSQEESCPTCCTKETSSFRSWLTTPTPSTPKRIFRLPQKNNSTDTILTIESSVDGGGSRGDSDSLASSSSCSCSDADEGKEASTLSVKRQDIEKVALACGAVIVD